MAGWVGHVGWLESGRFIHKVVTRPAVSLVQDRESVLARTGGLTTMLRRRFRVDSFHGTELLERNSLFVCPYFRPSTKSFLSDLNEIPL